MADDVADNWETLLDGHELDKQLKLLEKAAEDKLQESRVELPFVGSSSQNNLMGPMRPAVKILKRETAQDLQSSQKPSSTAKVRTLEERVAAYSEARMRILGAADSSLSESSGFDNPTIDAGCPSQIMTKTSDSSIGQDNDKNKGSFKVR